MKKRFSDHQIMSILNQAEQGVSVPDLCREHGMGSASFYKWRSKCGGMDASMISELKAIKEEHRRLKKMYADVLDINNERKTEYISCLSLYYELIPIMA